MGKSDASRATESA